MPDQIANQAASEDARRAKETNKLVKDIKAGEAWVIAIGVLTLLVNIAIGAIYYGQLVEMRKSTDDATAESQISNSTLKELKTGPGAQDTHLLAQQAVKQATETKSMLSAAGAQAEAVKLLADRAADQAQSAAQEAAAAQQAATAATRLASQSNQQAAAANSLATQSNKLAEAAQKANENTVAANRPWVALHNSASGFEIEKKRKSSSITVTITASNSGRRPAKLTAFSAGSGFFPAFPEAPSYGTDHAITSGVIVPGDASSIQLLLSEEIVKQLQSAVPTPQGQYYIYADVEYIDELTGEQHSTHASWVYTPRTESTPAGFVLARSYNDAK